MMAGDMSSMVLAVLPETGLLVLMGIILTLDLTLPAKEKKFLGWVALIGLLVVIGMSIVFVRLPQQPELVWGGNLRLDAAGFVFRLLFLAGAALTVLFSLDNPDNGRKGEYYLLLLVSVLGMSLMASAADLIVLYLAIETTSIPLFILAGFNIRDPKSVEAGIKYMLFGAMASTVMVYGFSLLYGFSGTTSIYEIAAQLKSAQIPLAALGTAIMLILAGFSFKVSAAPFHFWAPDVYEGAPTPIAGFLSTASKAAGFAVLIRFLPVALPGQSPVWMLLVSLLAVASMVVGKFLALAQKNIKRLLAYSSLALAGYILIGVASGSAAGFSGAVYYLMAYLLTNLAAFGIVTVVGRSLGSDEISAYAGLSRRSRGLSLMMLVALLSLGGIPPFAGFIGKLLVFASAIQSGMTWLAFVGALNTIVALYYYLTVLKVIYLCLEPLSYC